MQDKLVSTGYGPVGVTIGMGFGSLPWYAGLIVIGLTFILMYYEYREAR